MNCTNVTYFEAIFDGKPFESIGREIVRSGYSNFLQACLILTAICSFGFWIRRRKIEIWQLDLFGVLLCSTLPLYYGTMVVMKYFDWPELLLMEMDVIYYILLAIHVTSLVTWVPCAIQVYFQRPSYFLVPFRDHRLGFKTKIVFATCVLFLQILTVKFFFGVATLGCVSNEEFAKTQFDMMLFMGHNFFWIFNMSVFWYRWTCSGFWLVDKKKNEKRKVYRSEDSEKKATKVRA